MEDMLFYVHNTFTHFLLAYISLKCNSRWECNFGLEIFARLKQWIHKKIVARVFMIRFFIFHVQTRIDRGWVKLIRLTYSNHVVHHCFGVLCFLLNWKCFAVGICYIIEFNNDFTAFDQLHLEVKLIKIF